MSKITTKSQKLVDQLLVGLIIVGVLLIWFSIFEAKWIQVSIGALLAASSYLLLHTRIKKRVHAFSDKIKGQMEMIKDITSTGFKVFKLEEQSTALLQWRDINQVVLKNKTELVFKFKDNTEKIFKTSTISYYDLLKKIPKENIQLILTMATKKDL